MVDPDVYHPPSVQISIISQYLSSLTALIWPYNYLTRIMDTAKTLILSVGPSTCYLKPSKALWTVSAALLTLFDRLIPSRTLPGLCSGLAPPFLPFNASFNSTEPDRSCSDCSPRSQRGSRNKTRRPCPTLVAWTNPGRNAPHIRPNVRSRMVQMYTRRDSCLAESISSRYRSPLRP